MLIPLSPHTPLAVAFRIEHYHQLGPRSDKLSEGDKHQSPNLLPSSLPNPKVCTSARDPTRRILIVVNTHCLGRSPTIGSA